MKKENILILTTLIFLTGCGDKQNSKLSNEYFYLNKKVKVKEEVKEEFKEEVKEEVKNTTKNNENINDNNKNNTNIEELKNNEKNEEKIIEKIKDNNIDKDENIKNFEYFVIVLKNDKKEKIKISKSFYINNFKDLTNEELNNKFLKDKESEEQYKIIKILKEEKNEL